MSRYACKTVIFNLFAIFWLVAVMAPAYAKGSKEADLQRADELILQKEYDEAILILTDYGKGSSDRFDQAQQRLKRIYLIREEFNIIADELIETLIEEPDNDEKILTLTEKLRTLENDNSPVMKNFVSSIYQIAQFNVLRNRLREILERGRQALDRGDGEAAMQIYASGMNIMRDEFYSAGYGNRIENTARQGTERINAVVSGFNQTSNQMGTISAELSRAISAGQVSAFTQIINRLTPAIDNFITQKQILYTTLRSFEEILEEIKKIEPDMIDQNHLSFITVLINGRTDEGIQEGMLGAFEVYWNNSIGTVINNITSSVETLNATGLSALGMRNYTAAVNSLRDTNTLVNYTPFFFEKHIQLQGSQPQTVTLFENRIYRNDTEHFLRLISLREASASLSQAASVSMRLNIDRSTLIAYQQGTISAEEALMREQQLITSISSIQNDLAAIKNRASATDAQISTYYAFPYLKSAINAIDNVATSFISETQLSVQRFSEIALSYHNQVLASGKSGIENSKSLLNGQTRTNADGIPTTYYYPDEALNLLVPLISLLNAEIDRGNTITTQLRNNNQTAETISAYQSVINQIITVRNEANALAETARSRTLLAETHRREGERLFREAQAAFQRQDYETARTTIQRSSDRFDNSLEIQESASARDYRDVQLVNLGQAIALAENERIIIEVRNLVNNARTNYFEGNLQQAEDNLVRARSRWSITSPDENEEIVYWLGMVRGAMSARSGRVIPVTAPLYPEMSQLLSQAQRNFDEGVRLINSGRRAQGLAKFDEARMQTREVRLMFPVNQEAGLLELRMDQITDPAAFDASYEQRLRTAIAGTKRGSLESFAEIQNLAEINPRYPGIRGIVTQAEIDMGLRPPPPNPANIARARELTASASRILDSNNTAQFEVALTQVNEAITLDPNNQEATRVKDRLLNRMNVPTAIVMSSEDESDYQRALREFQAGNNLVALALVERLMQNPRNRNVTKLIELQRRIQAAAL